ncbi:MAG: LptF/LptG family permease [Bacteroidota bacterium]
MKHLHRMILRMLPGPFFAWLGVLMFLFLMQFLMRWLEDIVGKGLPTGVIIELIAYNLAYMLVLAVPMSALMATLMTYGRLAETNAYTVMKSAGVSLGQLMKPAIAASLVVMGLMLHFNNMILPEANFRARNLWSDIRSKKADFALEPGVFSDDVNRYSIRIEGRDADAGTLQNITIYDYSEGSRRQVTIKAAEGRLVPAPGDTLAQDLWLTNGEMHRPVPVSSLPEEDRYERIRFERHRLRLSFADFAFERRDDRGFRSDRTMQTPALLAYVDTLKGMVADNNAELWTLMSGMAADTVLAGLRAPAATDAAGLPQPRAPDGPPLDSSHARVLLHGLTTDDQRTVYDQTLQLVRSKQQLVDRLRQRNERLTSRQARYLVEAHKKFSIGTAILLFILIGAPLGLRIRQGGLGVIGVVATVIFLAYWVLLVQGEKLADRGKLSPIIGMWTANVLVLSGAITLIWAVAKDLGSGWSMPTSWQEIKQRFRRAAPERGDA